MIEKRVIQAMFAPSRFLTFPADVSEDFPDHGETMQVIANNSIYTCNINRMDFGNMCNLYVLANQGYDEWVADNYNVNDVIRFRRIYDAQGIVRVLIVQNN
ncbi:MAG: hypothetical protein H8E84_04990 [Flavobacteriales bacterium]|nr:hypothetical protein [Flavobacteriales bacterium]